MEGCQPKGATLELEAGGGGGGRRRRRRTEEAEEAEEDGGGGGGYPESLMGKSYGKSGYLGEKGT